MKKKIVLSVVASLIFAFVYLAEAQQAKKIPRIGFVVSTGSAVSPSPLLKWFQQGLRDLGYIEGKDILIEKRYAEGTLDRVPALVDELIQSRVDIIVATNNVAIRAAKKATNTIPIVMVSSVDPIAAGYVESLAHPGGNVTGLVSLSRELSAKRMELLREVLPKVSRVAILWDANGPGAIAAFKEYEEAARNFKLHLQSLKVRGPSPDIKGAFDAVKAERAEALIVVINPLTLEYQERIMELAISNRLPSMSEDVRFIDAGCLFSYGVTTPDLLRRAATYVDKILKGAKPADLPVEQPTKFEFVINLKTAKQIGLTIPQSVIYQADKVIK